MKEIKKVPVFLKHSVYSQTSDIVTLWFKVTEALYYKSHS